MGVDPESQPAPSEHTALNGIANGAQTSAHVEQAQVKVALTVDADSFVRVEIKGGTLASVCSPHMIGP